MARGPSAKRYAQGLFDLARERKAVERWSKDLESSVELFKAPDVLPILQSPKVRLGQKYAVLEESLGKIDPLALNLLKLLTARGLPHLLPDVLEHYQGLLDQSQGIRRAEVVTAVPLDPAESQQLMQRLKEMLGQEVRIVTRVDPAILGGLIAKVGDQIIDGSTRTRLSQMRKSLTTVAT